MNQQMTQQSNGVPNVTHQSVEALTRAGSVRQIQTRYSTALSVPKPRNIPDVESTLLKEAALAGDSFFYGWGAGKNRIEGPTIDCAMSLIRCWGNCAIEMHDVQETHNAWVFTASFVDLETGFTLSRQFRQSKRWEVHGKHNEERKDDMRFQIGQSKAIRNVVLTALPKWLVAKTVAQAKIGVNREVEQAIQSHGLEKVQSTTVQRLAEVGVTEEQILSKFGRGVISGLTVEDLVLMRGDYAALRDQQDKVENIYPVAEVKAPKGASKTKTPETLNDLIPNSLSGPSDAT